MTTIEVYKKMLAYLLDKHLAENYACIARKAGINEVQISRSRNGKVKNVKEGTMRKINDAYGNIFNPEWIRGESDVMLTKDLTPTAPEVGTDSPVVMPDQQSMLQANVLIASKDETIVSKNETIEALKREGTAKEETISELRGRLADKERLISSLQQQLLDLQMQKGVSSGFPGLGVAEQDCRRPTT